VVEWRDNQRVKDTKVMTGPERERERERERENVGLLAFQPRDAAASPTVFYSI
jgi:hypothetical protein